MMKGVPSLALFTTALALLCILGSTMARSPCRHRHRRGFFFPLLSSSSDLLLFGDSQIADSGVVISGQVLFGHPVRMAGSARFHGPTSFSTFFSFSASPDGAVTGDRLSFVVLPDKEIYEKPVPHSIAVGFEPYQNRVGLNLETPVSVASANVSELGLTLSSGETIHAWIDYNVLTQTLEIRLSSARDGMPTESLLSYPIDLSTFWKEEMYIGFSSSSLSEKPTQTLIIHSWGFATRRFPPTVHSFPANPNRPGFWHGYDHERHHHKFSHDHGFQYHHSHAFGRVVYSILLGAGCGTLFAGTMLLLASIASKLRQRYGSDSQKSSSSSPIFGYQKIATSETAIETPV